MYGSARSRASGGCAARGPEGAIADARAARRRGTPCARPRGPSDARRPIAGPGPMTRGPAAHGARRTSRGASTGAAPGSEPRTLRATRPRPRRCSRSGSGARGDRCGGLRECDRRGGRPPGGPPAPPRAGTGSSCETGAPCPRRSERRPLRGRGTGAAGAPPAPRTQWALLREGEPARRAGHASPAAKGSPRPRTRRRSRRPGAASRQRTDRPPRRGRAPGSLR